MSNIRLQIQVLPWQDSTSPLQDTRQEAILPWTEPCSRDLTIQDLCEKIVSRFATIHRGKGALNIKYLQDFYGGVLDTSLSIGDIFDDRARGGDIRNSIVKVARFPPAPAELDNPHRFASLDRDSSARPQKRPLPQPFPPVWASLPNRHNSQSWESEHSHNNARETKRRKIWNTSTRAVFDSDCPIPSREGLEDRLYNSPQTSPAQMSSRIQIVDSQRSPPRKLRNPYGTPTSLSVHSPHGPVPSKLCHFVIIPDSPPSRGTSFINNAVFDPSDHRVRAARSESVELGSIPKEGPLQSSGVTCLKQTQVDSQTPVAPIDPVDPIDSSQLVLKPVISCSANLQGNPVNLVPHGTSQTHKAPLEPNGKASAEKLPLPESLTWLMSRGLDGSQTGSRDIIDPFDIDNESLYEPPRLSNVKRLKGSRPKLEKSPQEGLSRNNSISLGSESCEKGGKRHEASIIQDNKPPNKARNQSTGNATGEVFDKDQPQMEPVTKDITGELQPADGTKESTLAKEKEHSDTILTEPKAIHASQQVQGVIPVTQKPKTFAVKARAKAGKQTEGAKGERTRAKEKDKPTKIAETEESTKEQQMKVSVDMRKPKHIEVHEEKKLLGVKKSNSLGISKPHRDESPAARDGSTGVFEPTEANGKGRTYQNAQLMSKVVDQNRSKDLAEAVPLSKDSSMAQSRSSVTPSATQNELDRARKSMTPAFPASLVSKPRQIDSVSLQGTPLGNLGNSGTQLKSALRHTPSTIRSKVKFQDDSVTVPETEPQREMNPSVKSVPDQTALVALTKSKPLKDKLRKFTDTSTKSIRQEKEKLQSKLTISRKKMKDRIVDPPVSFASASPEQIVISSDSEYSVSSYYSEDDPKIRNAKAGPSKRRKSSAHVASGEKIGLIKVEPTSPTSPSSNLITKAEEKQSSAPSPKATQSKTKRSSAAAMGASKNQSSNLEIIIDNLDKDHTSSTRSIDPQLIGLSSERSSPRAPARYMSRAGSINSSSSSNESESESGNNSSSSHEQTTRTPVKTNTSPELVLPDTNEEVEEVQLEPTLPSGIVSVPSSSRAFSNGSRNSESSKVIESKRAEHAAEEQLQRECHQSTQPSRVSSQASMISLIAGQKPATSSASKPSAVNSRWASMADMVNKKPPDINVRSGSRRHNNSSASKSTEPKGKALSPFSISGSSSDETSSSDGEEV